MKKQSNRLKRNAMTGYLFISLWIVGFLLFSVYPIVYSLYLSFQEVVIGAESISTTAVGFENYSSLFTLNMEFMRNLMDYFKKMLVSVPLVVILALILAKLLNTKTKGQTLFRTIFFMPVIIISGPIMEIFTKNLVFETLIDFESLTLLNSIERSSFSMLSDVVVFLVQNISDILWYTGVPIVIFITGFQRISPEVYEAASIDGANAWQCFWKITLPTMVGFIIINAIFTVVQISTMDSMPIVSSISSSMFNLNLGFGYAAAMAWVYFLAMLLVIIAFIGLISIFKKGE
ncbi:MAG: sugar ABC transporter permease [Eubacteriales bacterium]